MSLGVIFHFGIYSVTAFDSVDSARRRKTQNGSEWYLKRLRVEPGSYRPTSGWRETQEHHDKNHKGADYFDLADGISVGKKDIDDWMDVCREIGASYAILTSRHHDGFCLWNTKTTESNSCMRGPKIDIVKMFRDSALEHGLEFGIYYSWFEFERRFTVEYFDTVCVPQIQELINYQPTHWWFDGDWVITQQVILGKIDRLCEEIRSNIGNVQINDRICMGKRVSVPDYCSYRVFSDRYMPAAVGAEKPGCRWQHINTIGYSWGYNRQQKEGDHKTGTELFDLYQRVRQLGGEFLINIGPKGTGDISEYERHSLMDFAKIKKSSEEEIA